MSCAARKYLLWCANVHVEFRIPELMSIASMFKIPIRWVEKPEEDPYMIVEMQNENDAKKLMSRSMLVRSCYELWGEGKSEAEMHSNVKAFPKEIMSPHLTANKSYRVTINTFNKTFDTKEKLDKIETLRYLPFEGRVDLKNADTRLHLIYYYGLHPNHIPQEAYKVFLGRWVAEGQRDLINKYSLKQRSYIGSTSMDAELAFIMTNMAQVKQGDIVVDPFVGTGSVLVSAGHWGGNVWGWDIDYLTLHARTKPTRHSQKKRGLRESVSSNFDQYGLNNRYLDVAVMDNARSFWRSTPFADVIVTDPPYGIREATERVGTVKKQKNSTENSPSPTPLNSQENSSIPNSKNPSKENSTSPTPTNSRENTPESHTGTAIQNCEASPDRQCSSSPTNSSSGVHFPSKISYNLSDIFYDLLNFAAVHLVIGGRLVFWLPVCREDYDENQVPCHPCLELQYNCEQVLTVHSSRRLITLKKTRHPQGGETASGMVQDVNAQFRDKFFQASLLTKAERQTLKMQFPRDKRGQGLGYRLEQDGSKPGFIKPASKNSK